MPPSKPPANSADADWRPSADLAALKTRARVLRQIREFFFAREVLELPTSVLGRCGVTEPNIESIAVADYGYLQTSPEYQLKRALAAGAPSCYQLGPAFRHGEAGRLHNPEFTLLEWYRLGMTDVELRVEVTELVDLILGPAPVVTRSYAQLLQSAPANAQHLTPEEQEDLRILDAIAAMTDQGLSRVFITDYPASQAALARLQIAAPELAARFELVVQGVEIANGYYELADPVELHRRFVRDQVKRADQGKPDMAIDERLLTALEFGLPQCAGVAIGVDRLVMLAHGASSLREVMPFPTDLA